MNNSIQTIRADGFSLVELLISILILSTIMGAALSLFSLGVTQHDTEQNAVDMSQGARSGLELMTMEIAQAGSHGDIQTTTQGAISTTGDQSVNVASGIGFAVGDYVSVDTGASNEVVEITALGSNSISGSFHKGHASGAPVRLFALPYLTGVVRPAGLGANSSVTVTTLKFFGNVNGDGKIYYVEYAYDAVNAQIVRSMTPITQATKNAALPIVNNVKANSASFTLFTDSRGVVTAVRLDFAVQATWKTGPKYQETALSTKVVIPCAVAASDLLHEVIVFGGINQLPPTPAQVTAWAS